MEERACFRRTISPGGLPCLEEGRGSSGNRPMKRGASLTSSPHKLRPGLFRRMRTWAIGPAPGLKELLPCIGPLPEWTSVDLAPPFPLPIRLATALPACHGPSGSLDAPAWAGPPSAPSSTRTRVSALHGTTTGPGPPLTAEPSELKACRQRS